MSNHTLQNGITDQVCSTTISMYNVTIDRLVQYQEGNRVSS